MATSTPPGNQTNLGMAPNVAGLLCYVPCCIGLVFSVVAAIVEKQSRFVRFHAFQSLLLHGAAIVVGVVLQILTGVFTAIGIGILGMLVWAVLMAGRRGAPRRHHLADDQGERRRGAGAAGDRADGPSVGLARSGRS